jgi:hypothetical protein
MTIGALLKEVAFAMLIDVERDEIHRGTVVDAVPSIAVEEAVDDVLGMEISSIRGNYACEAEALSWCHVGSHGVP